MIFIYLLSHISLQNSKKVLKGNQNTQTCMIVDHFFPEREFLAELHLSDFYAKKFERIILKKDPEI